MPAAMAVLQPSPLPESPAILLQTLHGGRYRFVRMGIRHLQTEHTVSIMRGIYHRADGIHCLSQCRVILPYGLHIRLAADNSAEDICRDHTALS